MATLNTVLVTGANGFVGREVCTILLAQGITVLAAVRSTDAELPDGVEPVLFGDLETADFSGVFDEVDVVIHLAARVHIMNETAENPLEAHRRVNRDTTLRVARAAALSGVKRFVYASTVKVHGENTPPDQPFTEADTPAPRDPYAQSKWEAEQGLMKMHQNGEIEVCVIRPPLVYGPGVKANFLSLMKLAHKGLPLPLGAVHNRRSLVSLRNLAAALIHVTGHDNAAGRTFLVADGPALSTGELYSLLARSLGRKVWLPPVPVSFMRKCASMLGKEAITDRLFGSLCVDATAIAEQTNFTPPESIYEAMDRTTHDYLDEKDK